MRECCDVSQTAEEYEKDVESDKCASVGLCKPEPFDISTRPSTSPLGPSLFSSPRNVRTHKCPRSTPPHGRKAHRKAQEAALSLLAWR